MRNRNSHKKAPNQTKPSPAGRTRNATKSTQAAPTVKISEPKFKPLNKSQQNAISVIEKNLITFLIGPAGTSKTHTATAWALLSASKKQHEKIIITRPLVEAGESLGFLPGGLEDKVDPFMIPIYECAEQIGVKDVKLIVRPLAYMRGITFKNSVAILDEAQNCTLKQLTTYLTRFGANSKMIICGDPKQLDIDNSGLLSVIQKLKDIEGIGVFEFKKSDNVRHKIVTQICEKLNA